jgi:hypothetical protein
VSPPSGRPGPRNGDVWSHRTLCLAAPGALTAC